jgi:threonine/homoserine/homoserine lactone efflux protein
MENYEFWSLYVITVFVASIIPGPSMLLALATGLKHETKACVITALGNTVASMIQAGIAITGLGIILTTSTTLFMIIKYCGALYLIYLGFKLFHTPLSLEEQKEHQHISKKKLFSEAFIVAASNPKALVFFTALYPQFISNSNNTLFYYTLLVSVLGLIAFVCMMIYSLAASFIKQRLSQNSLAQHMGKIIGGLFMTLGVSLALYRR